MAYRSRVFVSFDGDNDMRYYQLMRAWRQMDGSAFPFFDAHDLNYASDTSQEESIKRQLRTRLLNSKVFVSLVGESTRYLYKFVRWEIEQAISLRLPIIVVNLNGIRHLDQLRCPPILNDHSAIHVNFNQKILIFALENWPSQYPNLTASGRSGPFYYDHNVYLELGA